MIKLAPSSIEAGDKSHKIGYVGIVNKDGDLIRTSKDITISLESENSLIASVPSEVTIPGNSQYATFDVKTTQTSGSTRIFASFLDDLDYDTITVGTIQDDVENDLKLVVNMATDEMNVNSEMPFSLYLQNSEGEIAQAPFDIIILLDYEESLVSIDLPDPTIKKGNSYVWGIIKSHDKVGNAFLRASSDKVGFDEAKEIKISSSLPSSLSVSVFPEKNPATVKRDMDLVVSLVDSDGLPTLAQEDVKLEFFSDDQSIGDQIDKYLKESALIPIIKKGEFSYHHKQRIDLKKENDTITVGATTKGLGVGMDTFETVTPLTTGNPIAENKTMRIFTLDKIPTNSETIAIFQVGILVDKTDEDDEEVQSSSNEEKEKVFHPLIVNENYDSVGSDQKISMISSNDLLLRINALGRVDATSSYGSSVIETGQETGTVVLSSTIKGIGATSTTTEIINTLKQEKTKIFSPTGNDSILFDKNGYFDLFIISVDSKDRPAVVENEVRYLIRPINEILTIEKGKSFSHVSFLGNSIQSENQEKITIETIPIGESADADLEVENIFDKEPTAKLMVALPFDTVNPDNVKYTGVIQLHDFRDNPVTIYEDLRVKLTPSELGLVDVPDYVTIPKGLSYVEFPVETKGKTGSTILDASAKGIVGAQTEILAESPATKLKISLGSIQEPLPIDQPIELKIYVDDEEQNSVGGVTLRIVSSDSSITPDTVTTSDDGSAIIKLNAKQAPKTALQILASAEGYSEEQTTFEFDVSGTSSVEKTTLPDWIIYGGIGGVVAVVGGMVFFLKKPKKITEEDEEELYE
jgi:hypothetical protein